MTDEANNPATELASPAAPAEAPAEPQSSWTPDEPAEQQEQPALNEEEFEEVEIEGTKLKVPKSLKLRDKIMLQADYTRKRQEAVEREKQFKEQFEREIAERKQKVEAEAELVSQHEELAFTRKVIRDYEKLTPQQWAQWAQENPQAVASAQAEWNAYKAQEQRLANDLKQARERKALESQQSRESEIAKRREQAEAIYRAEIKDWSPSKAEELANFAMKSLGAQQQDLNGVALHPWIVKALHRASLYDQMEKEAAQATNARPPAQPLRTIAGTANKGAVNPDAMSIDEWMKREDARERERRKVRGY